MSSNSQLFFDLVEDALGYVQRYNIDGLKVYTYRGNYPEIVLPVLRKYSDLILYDNTKNINNKRNNIHGPCKVHDGVACVIDVANTEDLKKIVSRNTFSHLRRITKKYDNILNVEMTYDENIIEKWYVSNFIKLCVNKNINPYDFANIVTFSRYVSKVKPFLFYARQGDSIVGGFLVEEVSESYLRLKVITSTMRDLTDYMLLKFLLWSQNENISSFDLGIDPNPMSQKYMGVFNWKLKWGCKIAQKAFNFSINEGYILPGLNSSPFLLVCNSQSGFEFYLHDISVPNLKKRLERVGVIKEI